MDDYLQSAILQFNRYKSLGEKAMAQVPDESLFWQYNPESNSIAVIVKHLWGNMLSRWTDFLDSDGEKPGRNRDTEFINDLQLRQEVMEKWEEGWSCLLKALTSLTGADLHKTVLIRSEAHSVMEAINRQLTHYSYHVGQIVFVARMISAGDWQSLSIPRGKSDEFNQAMFSRSEAK